MPQQLRGAGTVEDHKKRIAKQKKLRDDQIKQWVADGFMEVTDNQWLRLNVTSASMSLAKLCYYMLLAMKYIV